MSKLIDNYRAVNEGRMAKSEFLRQTRQQYPGYINQFTSFDDAVQIFRNKGILSEEVMYQCPGDKFPLEQIEKGIDVELEAMGLNPMLTPTPGDYKKAKVKAIENLTKDPLFYIKQEACCCDKCKQTQADAEAKKGKDYKQAKAEGEMQVVKPGQAKVKPAAKAKLNEDLTALNIPRRLRQTMEDMQIGTDKAFKVDDDRTYNLHKEGKDNVTVARANYRGKAFTGSINSAVTFIMNDKANLKEADMEDDDPTKRATTKEKSFTEKDKVHMQLVTALLQRVNPETGKKYTQQEARKKATKMIKAKQAKKEDKAMKEQKVLQENIQRVIAKVLTEAATTNLAQLSDQNATIQGVPAILNSLENIVTEIESFILKEQEKIQSAFDQIGNIKNEDNIPIGYKFVEPILNSLKQDLQPVLEKINLDDLKLPEAPAPDETALEEPDKENLVGPGIDDVASDEVKKTVFAPKGNKPQPLAESIFKSKTLPSEIPGDIAAVLRTLAAEAIDVRKIRDIYNYLLNSFDEFWEKMRERYDLDYDEARLCTDAVWKKWGNQIVQIFREALNKPLRTRTQPLAESKSNRRYTK